MTTGRAGVVFKGRSSASQRSNRPGDRAGAVKRAGNYIMIGDIERPILNEQALDARIVLIAKVAVGLRKQAPHGFAQRDAEGRDERRPLMLKPVDRPPRIAEAAQNQI